MAALPLPALCIALALVVAIGAVVGVYLLLADDGRDTVVKSTSARDESTAPPGSPTAEPSADSTLADSTPADGDLPTTDELFVNPSSAVATWLTTNPRHPDAALIRDSIVGKPGVRWFGAWNTALTNDVRSHVGTAERAGGVPVMIHFDAGLGACPPVLSENETALKTYLAQVQALADGIGESRVILLLQPWLLSNLACTEDDRERELRLRAASQGIEILRASAPNALVYLHGSIVDSDPAKTVGLLDEAGLEEAHGFVLNVIATTPNTVVIDEANALLETMEARLGYRKPYVIDTVYNGSELKGDTCNSPTSESANHPSAANLGRDRSTCCGSATPASPAATATWARGPREASSSRNSPSR
ncbi:MAG: hypothetical protein ACRCY9_04835, partial [Phycicoccus sp.]